MTSINCTIELSVQQRARRKIVLRAVLSCVNLKPSSRLLSPITELVSRNPQRNQSTFGSIWHVLWRVAHFDREGMSSSGILDVNAMHGAPRSESFSRTRVCSCACRDSSLFSHFEQYKMKQCESLKLLVENTKELVTGIFTRLRSAAAERSIKRFKPMMKALVPYRRNWSSSASGSVITWIILLRRWNNYSDSSMTSSWRRCILLLRSHVSGPSRGMTASRGAFEFPRDVPNTTCEL